METVPKEKEKPLTIADNIERILSRPKPKEYFKFEMEVEGGKDWSLEVVPYRLSYGEVMEAAMILPDELKTTPEDIQLVKDGKGDEILNKKYSDEVEAGARAFQRYIFEKTLEKNFDELDVQAILKLWDSDVMYFLNFVEVSKAVWLKSNITKNLQKKKTLT